MIAARRRRASSRRRDRANERRRRVDRRITRTAMTNPGPRGGSRTAEPARHRRHRVHRIRDIEAAGAGRRAGDDGLPADRAAPLARGRALSAGHDERHRQRAAGRRAADRAARRAARSSARSPSACATPTPRSAARSSSAPGRSPCARARWSSTSRRSTASARASSTSSTATTSSRSTTSTSARSRRSIRIRRRSRGLHFFGIVQYIGADRTARLGRVLLADLRLHAAAGQRALRHHAEGTAAAEPVPQLLPAADRARRHRALRAGGGAPAARSGSARRTCSPPSPTLEQARRRVPGLGEGAFERPRRAHQGRARQRDVRARARRARDAAATPMNFNDFGMDTASLAGSLESEARRSARARVSRR